MAVIALKCPDIQVVVLDVNEGSCAILLMVLCVCMCWLSAAIAKESGSMLCPEPDNLQLTVQRCRTVATCV